MKKLLFGLLIASFASCEKSETTAPVCYLAREVNSSDYLIYTYNTKNELVSYTSSSVDVSTLTYDDSGKIISELDNDDISVTYNYDNKNRLILWEETSLSYPSYKLQTKFFYNAADQDTLQQLYRYQSDSSKFYLWRYLKLSYESANTKNYSKRRLFDAASDTLIYTEDFLWDTHPNPYLTNPFFMNEPPPSNNETQYTYTLSGHAPQITIYTYTYNSNGFPLEKIIPGYWAIATYTYTNCK